MVRLLYHEQPVPLAIGNLNQTFSGIFLSLSYQEGSSAQFWTPTAFWNTLNRENNCIGAQPTPPSQ